MYSKRLLWLIVLCGLSFPAVWIVIVVRSTMQPTSDLGSTIIAILGFGIATQALKIESKKMRPNPYTNKVLVRIMIFLRVFLVILAVVTIGFLLFVKNSL